MEDLIKGELDWHNKVNENFHEVDSQMADIAVDVKNFGAISLYDDPTFDSSEAFQNAINYLSNTTSDAWTGSRGGGMLIIPPGAYKISGVTVNSKIRIIGTQGSTWIIPDLTKDDYAFKTNLYSNSTRHESINFENFSIAKSLDSLISSKYESGDIAKGIYLGSGNGGESLRHISIYGLETGVKLQNDFDVDFEGVEIISCNHNLVLSTSIAEVTNAIDLMGIRLELGVTSNLDIIDENPNTKSQVRSIQFMGGKIEEGNIYIAGVRDLKFIGPNIVWSKSGTMIQVNKVPPDSNIDISTVGQSDMISFIGCGFLGSTNNLDSKFIDNLTSGYPINLIGCQYTNLNANSFQGYINVIGGTTIEANATSFNVSSVKNLIKASGSNVNIPLVSTFHDFNSQFNILLNQDDNTHDTIIQPSKTYINAGGVTIILYLIITCTNTSSITGDYEIIKNGNSIGLVRGTLNGGTVDKFISVIINPGSTFRVQLSSASIKASKIETI